MPQRHAMTVEEFEDLDGHLAAVVELVPKFGGGELTCPFRKSYPRVAMMQPRQNGRSGNVSIPLDCSTQRRIFVQR
jgi:hypothetical protein